jgi:predicted enzyme related to lactoylglutathione lyase
MPITQAMATSFKVEILNGIHAFGTTVTRGATTADTFKIALYTSSATLGAGTTAYSSSNEITNTSGSAYTAGGATLTTVAPTSSGTTAYLDFNDVTWSAASFTANGALIYNDTQGDKAVAVLAFGSDKTASNGDFTIVFPTANSTDAIIRIQ